MKKFFSIILFLAVMVILPKGVMAAGFKGEPQEIPMYGTVEYEYTYTDEDEGIKEWKFYLTPNKDLVSVAFRFTPQNVEIQSIEKGEGVQYTDSKDEMFLVQYPSKAKKGEKILLATIITKDDGSDGCTVLYDPQALNCSSDPIDNNYFDDQGNILTKEQQDAACSGTTNTPSDIPNTPDTGSVIPYIAIGGGLVAVVGVYLYSRRHNKVYKI